MLCISSYPLPGIYKSLTTWCCHSWKGHFQQDTLSLSQAQTVKNLSVVLETHVGSLGWEDPLEKGMVTHSSILGPQNPMDRGACWATVHGVTQSWTGLGGFDCKCARSGVGFRPLGAVGASGSLPPWVARALSRHLKDSASRSLGPQEGEGMGKLYSEQIKCESSKSDWV